MSFRFLAGLARSRKGVVVCTEYGPETLLTLLTMKLRGQPTLVLQEHIGRGGTPLSSFDLRYRRVIGRLANGFVANTAAARDEIVRLLRVDPTKVFEVMYLVPPERAELCMTPLSLEPPQRRPLFLYLGQLIVAKNVQLLLEAARLLRDEGREFEVWIGGEGPDGRRLKEVTRQLALEAVVRFLGSVAYSSIGYVYEASDVFVMPSHRDYRSVAVLEAMRFGKPVLDSARDGNAHDTARDGFNALIFDPADARQLADCMREFTLTPGLALEMGARSAEILENHTPDSAALGLRDVVTRIRSAD